VDPITQSVSIDRPAGEVFAYLADIANHPEFCDHFLVDWHLTREDPYGQGAGARFKVKAGFTNRFSWGDMTFVEVTPGRRILARGRMGKFNRTLTRAVWEVGPGSGGATKVTVTFETKPKTPSDRLLEGPTARRMKRGYAKALRRLREILEEDRRRGTRASIAGGPRKPASQFRFDPSSLTAKP
jgi:uncharacterized protein YndB with AHSA1/START domain